MTSGISRRESGPEFFFSVKPRFTVNYDRRLLGGRGVQSPEDRWEGLCHRDDSPNILRASHTEEQ